MENLQTHIELLPEQADSRRSLLSEVAFQPPAREPFRLIDIQNVHNTIGVWHQEQYENLGIQRLALGAAAVKFDFKQPVEKTELFTTVNFDKSFTFNYTCQGSDWSLQNVKGLKIDGDTIVSAEANKKTITFLAHNGSQKHFQAATNYVRALLDPLMTCRFKR